MKKTKQNLIGLWVNLSRAYEIAKLGGLSIQVVYETDYISGKDDYSLIKEFYKDVEFKAQGDIVVEITKPDNYNPKRQFETLEDINKRIEKSKKQALPTEFANDACNQLLKVATQRLNLSLKDVQSVKEIAGVIAQAGLSKLIQTEHVAEAIHYQMTVDNDKHGVNAENSTLFFGKHIQIENVELDSEQINKAIEFLKSKL